MPPADVALIVTTYQMPGHLARALASIAGQRTRRRLEVIVADDGSQDETQHVVAAYAKRAPFSVRLVTHLHTGFRPALCRNEGVRHSTAPHLHFFDGDCVLPPDHVEAHLAAHRPGTVTSGYCVRLDEAASREVTLESIARGGFQRLAPPAELQKLAALHRKAWWYNLLGHATKPSLRSTDFSISRADYERVNGFDEQFRGWGCEDDDLGRRLIAAGIRPVSVLDRTRVYHLWHPPAPSKPNAWKEGDNVAYLERPIRLTRCLRGLINRHAHDLTVRLAGETDNAPALAHLMRVNGWSFESNPDRRADLEILTLPGRGCFRGAGDCRVLAAFSSISGLPWRGRSADIVLSSDGRAGHRDQVRLSLGNCLEIWQALCGVTLQTPYAPPVGELIPAASGA